MPLYSKESLEDLRRRVDLIDVLSSHLEMKRAGAAYKALCPFHEERSPSFVVQRGDTHYHCYGCGAHGDAIEFLMRHGGLSFQEAVESLAARFGVNLELVGEIRERKGPDKKSVLATLESACQFYHHQLFHSAEGREALAYLKARGLDEDFLTMFQVGLAPASGGLAAALRSQGFVPELLEVAGLLSRGREFFLERITFPIRDRVGAVIGFSARKYKESTFGGKYINTPETPVFKKSQVLYGLNYCRARIAKEHRAILVEGQIDCLRLIQLGVNLTVAGQGTAFGEGHARELLRLGVREVFIAFDGDAAGQEAAAKVGDLFQKEGVEVRVVAFPEGQDPDSVLQSGGVTAFLELLQKACDYLEFLVHHYSKTYPLDKPAGKSALVQRIAEQIRQWSSGVMVHESLRRLAEIVNIPVDLVGVPQRTPSQLYVHKSSKAGAFNEVDPDRILEGDLLRWLFFVGEKDTEIVELILNKVAPEHFRYPPCRQLFDAYREAHRQGKPKDLLSMTLQLHDERAQQLLSDVLHKKIDPERARDFVPVTIHKILEREWLWQREAILAKIAQAASAEEEALLLAREFDRLNRSRPSLEDLTF